MQEISFYLGVDMGVSKDRCFDCGEEKETVELDFGGKWGDVWGEPTVIRVCDICLKNRQDESTYETN